MIRLLSPLIVFLVAGCTVVPAAEVHAQNPASTKRNAPAKPSTPYGQRADAQQWAKDFAQQHHLDRQWVRAQLAQARFLPQVQRLMTPAPKTTTTARDWGNYRSRFIDPVRIRAGVKFWNDNAATLARAQAEYGVPAEMIVGIIGVETIYGRNMGNLRVLDSLATLAFDFPKAHPKAADRQRYFQGELAQFLLMMHQSGTPATESRGSYAGAMGLGQFMPSSWSNWAVDFDGDGKIDLFNSPADAIGSVAHYFQVHGWVQGEPVWFAPLFNRDQLDLPTLLAPDIKPTFSVSEMAALGVVPQNGLTHPGKLALVELRNGDAAPSYIVGTQNFYTITRYNWSSYYAMAVHDLGQEVAAARAGTVPAVAELAVIPEIEEPVTEPSEPTLSEGTAPPASTQTIEPLSP